MPNWSLGSLWSLVAQLSREDEAYNVPVGCELC